MRMTQRFHLLAAVSCALCCHTSLLGAVVPVTDANVQHGLSPYKRVCQARTATSQPPAQPDDRPTIAATRELSWRQTGTSVALLNHGRMVWEHVHDKRIGKPYMRFGLLDGTELTRPWPVPKDYPRNDHSWHRALWWSWKAINGVNYWEGNQTGTEPVRATIATKPDGSAQIEVAIAYHRPGESPVVLEKRRVTVSAPDADGAYFIGWETSFTPSGQDDVRFDRNSYGGFALRMAAECCGDAGRKIPAWTFGNSEGHADINNRAARWVSYQGTASNGQAACVAIFDHPDNPGHPALWQTRSHYPYLNPSLTCKEDYVLPSGQTLRLRYGVMVSAGPLDANAVEQRWKAFAGASAAAVRVNESFAGGCIGARLRVNVTPLIEPGFWWCRTSDGTVVATVARPWGIASPPSGDGSYQTVGICQPTVW